MSPRPSLVPDATETPQDDPYKDASASEKTASEGNKFNTRSGSCRICLKSFKPNDFKKTCVECDQKVCEDCASYSKLQDSEDSVSVGRRKGGGVGGRAFFGRDFLFELASNWSRCVIPPSFF